MESAEILEQTLEIFIANNPLDSSLYIRLALVLFRAPLRDNLKAIEILENLINIDPNNVYGMLLLHYIVDHTYLIESPQIVKKVFLNGFIHSDPSKGVTHRLFIKNGIIAGKPNIWPNKKG